MRKTISAVSMASALAMSAFAGLTLAGISPAAANPAQDKVISDFCNGQPNSDACNDWRYNRDRWSDGQYQSFYLDHRDSTAFETAEAADAFGRPGDAPVYRVLPAPTMTGRPVGSAPVYVIMPAPTVIGQSAGSQPGSTQPVYTVVPDTEPGGEQFVIGQKTGNVEGNRQEVIGDSNNHVGDCIATFKSYNVRTDTYMAFDGTTHRCKL